MIHEEVIERIKSGRFASEYGFDLQILVNAVGALGEMLRNGYTMAPPPRLMTLEEVRTAEVVWLEQVGVCVCAIKIQDFDSGTMSFAYAYNNYTSFVNIKPEYYGKVSRCWTSRPDEKVRAETAWVEPPKEDNDDEQ